MRIVAHVLAPARAVDSAHRVHVVPMNRSVQAHTTGGECAPSRASSSQREREDTASERAAYRL